MHAITHGSYNYSDDPTRIDLERVHLWLSESYWSPGISKERAQRALDHSSLIVGAYHPNFGQCGVARVVTDFTRFAYLMDAIVTPEHRGVGVGRAMVRFLLDHPTMGDIDTWALATRDAHSLYESLGFEREPDPDRWMVRRAQK